MGSDPSDVLPKPQAQAAGQDSTRRIALVCDDAPNITHFVARVAERLGIVCHEAGSAEAIQALALVHPTALIFLDLSLGRGDAVQVLKFLTAHKFAGSVVLISGHEQGVLDHVTDIGRRHGLAMLAPIRKPFAADPIRSVLIDAGLAAATRLKQPPPSGTADSARIPGNRAMPVAASARGDALSEQFELCYRPIVGLEDYRAAGIEACLRLGGRGKVLEASELKDRLSPEAAKSLTKGLVARAKADWEQLSEQGINLRFSLPVPCSEILNGQFCEVVREHWTDDPCWPGFLVEVDDECRDAGFDVMREEFIRLRLYKIAFSMSDLGRVSIRYDSYKSLQPGGLNLNRTFVQGCADDTYKAEICKVGVELGRKLGAPVTAKGLDDPDDLALVRSYGCTRGHGDLFSPATSFEKLAGLLRTGTPLYRSRGATSVKAVTAHV
jgi:EAL domain-containing protein (putative c-di-GMP-specific phosphodiesterase class I)/ActR/RegA family two-component response regulator